MNIDELKVREIREIAQMVGCGGAKTGGPYRIGDKVLIRTVTMTQTGRIVEVYPHELVLEDAAWIGDTGRFHVALRDGALSEIEPADGRVIVSRGSIVDCWEWRHDLPRSAK